MYPRFLGVPTSPAPFSSATSCHQINFKCYGFVFRSALLFHNISFIISRNTVSIYALWKFNHIQSATVWPVLSTVSCCVCRVSFFCFKLLDIWWKILQVFQHFKWKKFRCYNLMFNRHQPGSLCRYTPPNFLTPPSNFTAESAVFVG